MDPPALNWLDISEVYRRYSELRSGNGYLCNEGNFRQDDVSQRAKLSKDALNQLLKVLETRVHIWTSIFDELLRLMSQLDLMGDFSEFSRFYDFVFFICRENGQKNITVSKAISAWKLVLAGRFRLLNQWCDFIEKNQRHNISEDTWQQVLAFSRCVHENLEGYDPEGAWPVLIDDFVEHMYRVSGSNETSNLICSCGDTESQSYSYEDSLPGLRVFPGLKRKLPDAPKDEMDSSDTLLSDPMLNTKRSKSTALKPANCTDNLPGNSVDDSMEIVRNRSPLCSSKSPCAVEGCLSKGFAGLFSSRSYLQFDRERRVSYT